MKPLRNDGPVCTASPVRPIGERRDGSAGLVRDEDHAACVDSSVGDFRNHVGREEGVASFAGTNGCFEVPEACSQASLLGGCQAAACAEVVFFRHDSDCTSKWEALDWWLSLVSLGLSAALWWAMIESLYGWFSGHGA